MKNLKLSSGKFRIFFAPDIYFVLLLFKSNYIFIYIILVLKDTVVSYSIR
nr:MAG TPA: hypothetical protein [Caudoviricetes sp.]